MTSYDRFRAADAALTAASARHSAALRISTSAEFADASKAYTAAIDELLAASRAANAEFALRISTEEVQNV